MPPFLLVDMQVGREKIEEGMLAKGSKEKDERRTME